MNDTLAKALPNSETERLVALAAYDKAGAQPGANLDNIVHLAAELLQVPIALVSLVGSDRQTFAARIGMECDGTSRDVSFCSHTIQSSDVFVVPDATLDPRFAANPLVTGDPGIRFYAGAPLVSPINGQKVGSLCIIDRVPRASLGEREARLLTGLAALVVDRMELRRIEAERQAGLARFERMAAATPSAVVCTSADSRITYWNPAAERLFGWSAAEMLGGPLDRIFPERLRITHAEGLARLATRGEATSIGRTLILSALRRDGTEFPAEVTLACWREDDGRTAFGTSIRDITARHQAEEGLRHLAFHDPLTGLPNRVKLAEATHRAAAAGNRVGLILFDLDGFKHVNDRLGHAAGDALLREVAGRLAGWVDGRGLLARLGGDEFAMLVLDKPDYAAGEAIARDLLDTLRQAPFEIGGSVLHVEASAGLAVVPSAEAGLLLANADLALYRAKAEGGGICRSYQPMMRAAYEARRTLEEEVRRAAEAGEFVLLYQPQVRLSDGALVGAEALLRWQHPTRGLLTPDAFLSVLEVGMPAVQVGSWAIAEACRQAAIWRAAGLRLRVGVNVFAEQLRHGSLEATVEAALARHDLPPEALELELTERITLSEARISLEALWRLRARGIGISFDDFGTGYASLATLKRFPLTRLKIDRGFVSDLESDLHDAAIVDSILALSKRLGLEVTAEGIETEAQQACLLAQGCAEGQGYLYGRPMVPSELLDLGSRLTVCEAIT